MRDGPMHGRTKIERKYWSGLGRISGESCGSVEPDVLRRSRRDDVETSDP